MHAFGPCPDARDPGDASGEATPVPIPNTEVKLSSAEDTERAAFRENRSSPGFLRLRALVRRSVPGSEEAFVAGVSQGPPGPRTSRGPHCASGAAERGAQARPIVRPPGEGQPGAGWSESDAVRPTVSPVRGWEVPLAESEGPDDAACRGADRGPSVVVSGLHLGAAVIAVGGVAEIVFGVGRRAPLARVHRATPHSGPRAGQRPSRARPAGRRRGRQGAAAIH